MKNDFLVVIPARMGSTRFPGKVLALLNNKPVVEWCRQAAVAAKIGPVVVATESPEVVNALKKYGADVVLTSDKCVSGTDRVWEAAKKRMSRSSKFVLNLQGDEPLIRTATIKAVAEVLRKNKDADIATAVVPLHDTGASDNPNVVKAVVTAKKRCLYFSRSAIPYLKPGNQNGAPSFWKHIGIYGYRKASLKRFVGLKPSPLEMRESLEQLRALENGMTIDTAIVDDHTIAIDTPQDLAGAQEYISGRPQHG